MFYSHEILTQRKHGIATIWLVATLGPKANSKKVNKKAILGVNIPKACDTVTEPVAPMALRMQGNLLIGISRVFLSQCNYVLIDAESAQQKMRLMLQMVRNAQLDPDGVQARPEQLLLPDDPYFVPEAVPDIDLDLANLEMLSKSSVYLGSQSSSRRSALASIPSSPPAGLESEARSGEIRGDASRESQVLARAGDFPPGQIGIDFDEEQGLILDSGFTIDNEGNLVLDEMDMMFDVPLAARTAGALTDPATGGGLASTQAEEAAENAEQGILNAMDEDLLELQLVQAADDDQRLDLATVTREVDDEKQWQEYDAQHPRPRRQRMRKPLPMDSPTEIRNAELQRWQRDYLAHMRQAKQNASRHVKLADARSFAYRCVWGSGIGGLGVQGELIRNLGPLKDFAGQSLREMILGKDVASQTKLHVSRKRRMSPDSSESERNVRRRSDEIEQARGEVDEQPHFFGEDREIELGRRVEPALEDASMVMPWDPAPSATGASRVGSIRPGSRATSLGRPSSIGFRDLPLGYSGLPSSQPSSDPLERYGGLRSASGSPLRIRGRRSTIYSSDEDVGMTPGRMGVDESALRDFELSGEGFGDDTQNGSQWSQGGLHAEDANFLEFVEAETQKLNRSSITFSMLLPAQSTNRIVATQGFLRVLNLASNALLDVKQEARFGAPIDLSIPFEG